MSHLCAFDLIAWLPCHVSSSSSSSCVCVQGAVANAVGSQIINVFIGLGLPYAIAGSSLLDIHGVMTYLLCLLVCMLSFLVRKPGSVFPNFFRSSRACLGKSSFSTGATHPF
jgi:Ca2+/Na+ antiporter